MKRQRLLVAATVIGLSAPFLASMSGPAQAQGGYPSPQYQHQSSYEQHDWNRQGNYPLYPHMDAMRRVGWLRVT